MLAALLSLVILGVPGVAALELTWRFPAPPVSLERELGILARRLEGAFQAELAPVGTAGVRLRVPLASLPAAEALRAAAEDGDLASVASASDNLGYPGVSFALRNERKPDFMHWTGSIVGRSMAVLLDDEVLMLATPVESLTDGSLIGGRPGFEPWERDALIAILTHGRLEAAPRLLDARLVEPPR